MELLKSTILANKPKLTASSLKTYISTLTTLYKKVFDNKDDYLLTNFNNTNQILDHIKTKPASSRKSSLSALYVLTLNEKYKTEMLSCIAQHNQVVNKQEKTQKQKDNSITTEELKDIYDDLTNQAKFIYKKKKMTDKDFQQLQDYILISLTNGQFIPPRRSNDWCMFKLYNTDEKGCNYLDKNEFIFNTYKNSNTKGQQRVDVPIELKNIIEKYRKFSSNENLFYDLNGSACNATKICQRMNKIFGGKKISTNSMRHLYLSSRYKDTIETKNAMAKDMEAMGSSTAQQNVYIQK